MNEKRLAGVLVELAQTLTADYPIQAMLDHLAQRVIEVMDVTGAGVVLIGDDDRMQFVATTDETIRRIEELQLNLGEGPGLDAYRRGERVSVPDLATDLRFPRFSSCAARAGLFGVYTFPLQSDVGRIGTLDVYCNDLSQLDEADLAVAQILADVAAAYLLNVQSRTEMRELAAQSQLAAMHDQLTGLPNRVLLADRLDHALCRAPKASSHLGLLLLDLDRFKAINDQYGHQTGDRLLVMLANRLTGVLRPGDTLSRLSGDEFVVLCEDLASPAQANEIAGRVLQALATPFAFEHGTVTLSGSIGVTFAHKSPHRLRASEVHRVTEDLLREADAAMYQAKHSGGGRYTVVTSNIRAEASQRHVLERDLPQALNQGLLRLAYQPIAHARTGEWRSAEALLRWDHPSVGAVAAETIVATAERIGLMTLVGKWVLDRACADLARWRALPRLSHPMLTVAVNVSPTELLDPSYARSARAALSRHDLPTESLCLELTESVLVEDTLTTLTVLDTLKGFGITLALDDFGTGYSTLTYLRRLPADIVKIDRSFLAGFDAPAASHEDADRTIVSALISLSHALGLTVVAEGVETAGQLDRLRALDCDLIQGHLVTPPVSAARLEEILAQPVTVPLTVG